MALITVNSEEGLSELEDQCDGNLAVALEAVMTNSAFGHEYARMNLSDYCTFSKKEAILAQMEELKRLYFWARERLSKVNPERLSEVEEGLRIQKESILQESITIH